MKEPSQASNSAAHPISLPCRPDGARGRNPCKGMLHLRVLVSRAPRTMLREAGASSQCPTGVARQPGNDRPDSSDRMARQKTLTYGALLAAAALAAFLGVATAQPQLQNVAIAAAVFIVLVAPLVEAPEFAILVLLAVRPVADALVNTSVGGLTVGQAWGMGLITAIAIYFVSRRPVNVPAAPAALLLAYLSLTLVRPELKVALDTSLKLGSWLLLTVVIERVAQTRRGQVAIINSMWASAICLILAIALVMAQGRYGAAYYGLTQTTAEVAPPHSIASYAVLLLPLILAQILAGHRTQLSVVVSGLLALGIVASFVRTAYLALLAVLCAYVIAAVRVRAARAQLSAFAILTALVVAGYRFRDTLLARFSDLPLISSLTGRPLWQGGGAGRGLFWRDLWAAGTDSLPHIIAGRGAGASVQLLTRLYGAAIWSHNDFLEFFVTGGIILLVTYVIFLAWVLWSIVRLFRDDRQSEIVHTFSILLAGAFSGYVILSLANGMAVFAGSVAMAVLIGLTRGMSGTPGDTALDRPEGGALASIPRLAEGPHGDA